MGVTTFCVLFPFWLEPSGSYSGGWQSLFHTERNIHIIHQKQNRPVLAILGGSIRFGKISLFDNRNFIPRLQPCVKAHMIGYRLGSIMPRVSHHESIPVRLKSIPKGYLPRC